MLGSEFSDPATSGRVSQFCPPVPQIASDEPWGPFQGNIQDFPQCAIALAIYGIRITMRQCGLCRETKIKNLSPELI